MKNTRRKIKGLIALCLSFIMIMAMGITTYASPKEDTEAKLRETKGDYYADQWVQWQDMMENYKSRLSEQGDKAVKSGDKKKSA